MATEKKGKENKISYKVDDFVVYPTHGVGQVTGLEKATIAGHDLDLVVVSFNNDRMTLRVPINKIETSGLRKVSSRQIMDTAVMTLKGRARIKRTMWSRRAQEYEAKINSGDPVLLAEVVRDLHRNVGQPDQSFSERQIYESALDRLAGEFAAVESIDKGNATEKLEAVLQAA
ncbi:MAG: CarD family transcriptional regulator [Rhodospirillales bacterium]|jgi:CarD family transcriptional regulator